MVAVGIEVHDSRGVAHPCDGGRVVLLVLKHIISISLSHQTTVTSIYLHLCCVVLFQASLLHQIVPT